MRYIDYDYDDYDINQKFESSYPTIECPLKKYECDYAHANINYDRIENTYSYDDFTCEYEYSCLIDKCLKRGNKNLKCGVHFCPIDWLEDNEIEIENLIILIKGGFPLSELDMIKDFIGINGQVFPWEEEFSSEEVLKIKTAIIDRYL